MARIKRIRATATEHKAWKKGIVQQLSKTTKPIVESAVLSSIKPTYPQPSWLFRHKILFRCMHDLVNPKTEWTPSHLASKFRDNAPSNVIFFPDTNFFSVPMDFSVWDAMLTKKIAITPSVYSELKPWLATPFYNDKIRDLVIDASAGKSTAIELIGEKDLQNSSYRYYRALLTLRKMGWQSLYDEYFAKHGKEPSDEEMRKLIQSSFGDAATITLKAWESRNNGISFTDEELVLYAVLTSILRGAEVVILTRDSDVEKQFIYLTNLINGHYNTMWAGEHFWKFRDDYPGLFPPTIDVPETESGHPFGSGKLSGLTFPADSGVDFLPPSPIPAVMHCIYFERSRTERRYTVSTFYGETGMRNLLEIKEKSNGMNTNKFEGYNCHLTASHGKNKVPTLFFGLSRNTHETVQGVELSRSDIMHATQKRLNSTQVFYGF